MFYLPIASEVSYQIISVELISLQNIIIIIVTILPTHTEIPIITERGRYK